MPSTVRYLLILVASSSFWAVFSAVGWIDGLKQEAMSWRYLVRGERPASVPLTYVDLDASTVSLIGDKPWDRRLFGVLLEALLGPGKARAVGVDFILSRFGTSALLDESKAKEGDEFLGAVLERYPDQIVLGAAYTGVVEDYDGDVSDLRLIRDGHADPLFNPFPEAPTFPILKGGIGRLGLADVDEALNRSAVPSWVPAFVEIAGPRYSLHILDGIRRFWLRHAPSAEVQAEGPEFILKTDDGFEIARLPRERSMRLLTLGLELFLAANGLGPESIEQAGDHLLVRDPSGGVLRRIPLRSGQSFEVNWFNRWGNRAFERHVSMGEILNRANELAQAGRVQDQERIAALEDWFGQFRDAIILVGPVDPALKDVAPTPFETYPVPKVGLHGNIFRTIQDALFIRRLSPLGDILLIFLLTLLVGSLALWSGAARLVTRISAIVLLVSYIAGVYWAFSVYHVVLPLVAPTGSVVTALVLGALVKLSAEEWQRRRIRSLFGTYLSPALVDRMVESPEAPRLGGVEAEITALFTDVEGFSGFAETLAPERLVALMNEYLSALTAIIQEEGGTLDKYVGDAIVAMFGMPVRMDDHALRACRAASRMQQKHAELRSEWKNTGAWPEGVGTMRTRIGLNSGPAVIGNMGSDVRFSYTMMGDTVNLAARCESIGKFYGVRTVVAQPVVDATVGADDPLLVRHLDRVAVKGRAREVNLYELWDGSGDRHRFEACRGAYEAAWDCYRRADWSGALTGFAESANLEAGGPDRRHPSAVLAARCRDLASRAPVEGWDGVFRMGSGG